MSHRGLSGQSAIEYLMTYGWMLLVVAVVGGAIFATVNQESPNSVTGFTGSSVQVDDFGVTSDDDLEMELRSSTGQGATVSAINVTDESNGKYVYKEFSENNSVDVGESLVFDLPNVSQGDSSNSLDVEIVYDTGGLSNLTVSGSISGGLTVEETKQVMDNGQVQTLADDVAVTKIDQPDYPTSRGYLSDDGEVGMFIEGSPFYDISVLDLTDPSNPGFTQVSGPSDIINGGGLSDDGSVGLYGSQDDNGYVVDLSDPSNPSLAQVSTGNFVNDAALSDDGSTGLLASRDTNGYVLNLSDPSNPGVTQVTAPTQITDDAALSDNGKVGLIDDRSDTVHVLNLSDPSNPGRTEISADATDFALDQDGDVGLVESLYNDKVYVLNLSDLSNPGVTEVNNPNDQVYSISIDNDGSVGMIGSIDNNGYVLDLSDLSNPGVTEVNAPSDTVYTTLSDNGNVGLLDTGSDKGYVLDLSDPSAPVVSKVNDVLDNVGGDSALSDNGKVGLFGTGSFSSPYKSHVLDLSDLSNPSVTNVTEPQDKVDTSLNSDGSIGLLTSLDDNAYILH